MEQRGPGLPRPVRRPERRGRVHVPHLGAAAAALARAGFPQEAGRLARGLIAVAPHFAYRLPELFSGFGRDLGFPVGYPTTSSPQAWAAASVLLLLRVLLGLEADVPGGKLTIDPILPADALPLELEEVDLAGGRLSIRVGLPGDVRVTQLPDGLRLA